MASATGTNASSNRITFKMDTTTTTTNAPSKRTPPKVLSTACIKKHTLTLQSNIAQVLDSYCFQAPQTSPEGLCKGEADPMS
eukprot:12556259-Ditylum_brightwellii.AAC.1